MRICILIIDDEPRWKKFVKTELKTFKVVFAGDVNSALNQLNSLQFDLVIASSRKLDILELIKTKYPDKNVIVVTVQPKTEEAIRAYRLGATRYIAKSFRHTSLLNHIKEIIPGFTETTEIASI